MALGELKNGIGPDAYAIYQQVLAAVVERDHPVGSLYISENSTSPAELYGGTWERIEGKFIMGASDTYPAGSMGGSATHVQTVNELANHYHSRIYAHTYGQILLGQANQSSGESGYIGVIYGTGSTKALNTEELATNSQGGGQPIDILNPYYSTYIWRRVA